MRTPDGTLHMVYESSGHVWYETSKDEGASWILMNDGKPLDNGYGKLPSIDYIYYNDTNNNIEYYCTIITYQERNGSNYNIVAQAFLEESPWIPDGIFQFLDKTTVASL